MEKEYMEHDPDTFEQEKKEKDIDLRNTSVIYYLLEKHWVPTFRQYLFRTSDLI